MKNATENVKNTVPMSGNENGDGGSCSTPLLVIAKHKFEGRNNDELTFNKNDVIGVIQKLDGGWWEGSLDGRIGWFPSDFVGLVTASVAKNSGGSASKRLIGTDKEAEKQLEASRSAYRAEQIRNFIAKERENQQNIERVLNTLNALGRAAKRTSHNEFAFVTKSLTDFIALKRKVLKSLEEQTKNPMCAQIIGKIFLDIAVELKGILLGYCRQHCDLLDWINQDGNKIQQQLSAEKIDFKELIVGLSLVFRHVDKYANILQEIERNTPDDHPDKGNLHRAALVFRDFYGECERIRRQREAQLDFLRTGTLEQNLGDKFEQLLGPFLYIGKVTVAEQNKCGEETEMDRCVAVFERTILLFEICTLTGNYLLKNRLATDNLMLNWNSDNEISIKMGSKTVLVLRTVGKEDRKGLLEALRNCNGMIEDGEEGGKQSFEGKNDIYRREKPQTPRTMTDGVRNGGAAVSTPFSGNFRVNHQLEMILPDDDNPPNSHSSIELLDNNPTHQDLNSSTRCSTDLIKPFSGWTLRPFPPVRPQWFPSSANESAQIKMRKGLTTEEQEDALMLKIIEGYCISGASSSSPAMAPHYCNGRPYQQRNSAESCHSQMMMGGGPVRRTASYPDQHEISSTRPHLIVAEDEKLFVEEMDGDQIIVKERSLVDTVYALKEQISILSKEMNNIAKSLEQEQRARRRIEEIVRQTGLAQPTEGHSGGVPKSQQNGEESANQK